MGIEGQSQSGVASGERGRLGQNRPSDSQELSDELGAIGKIPHSLARLMIS
jgi:hypothetical protein